jgi:hypothetical protein
MFLQVISVAGALLILGAYLGYQRGWLGKEQRLYSAMNALGGAILTWVALADGRWGLRAGRGRVDAPLHPRPHPPPKARTGVMQAHP